MKAVAVQTLFIIVFIGLTIFFTLSVLNGWLGIQVPQLTSLGCASAKIDYCVSWQRTNNCQGAAPTNWDSDKCGPQPKSPTDCNPYCSGG